MVKFLFVESHYSKEVKLSEESLKLLSKYKKIALFASVQFVKLDIVKKQLADGGVEVLTTHAKRTSTDNQILGCDCTPDSFEDKEIFSKVDAVLYVGDGMFHPKALLLAQQDAERKKEVIIFDPMSDSVRVLSYAEIEKQKRKYQANLMSYLSAKRVGVLVSTKTGQQYLRLAQQLKRESKKEIYIFVGDSLNMLDIENYNFIEAWVNTACPRIGTDDIVNIPKPLVNIGDVLKS